MLVHGGSRYRKGNILGFLAAGFGAIAIAVAAPVWIPWMLAAYAVLTVGTAAATTRLPL